MTAHLFLSADEGVSCLVCGAYYDQTRIDHGIYGTCSGRTDLVHGYDWSSHSLDGCAAFDRCGSCEHTDFECDCDLCAAYPHCTQCGDRIDYCQGHPAKSGKIDE